jgi:type II secretory pathway component PulM
MNLDDIKDNLKSQLSQIGSRLQESSSYNQLKDRFENLAPRQQKLVAIGAGVFLAFVLISIPYSYFSTSSEYITTFEEKRALIRELLKVTRESSEVPDIQSPPPAEMLRATVDQQLKSANLLPEQVKGISVVAADTSLIPRSLLDSALQVNLAKLNLRQIIDIGYGIQRISQSVKMNDLRITANAEDPKYFDAEFKVVTLAVPQAPAEAPEPEPKGHSGGSIRPKGKK